jgi:hypothetical protein
MKTMDADGHCLFRSVADQLYDDVERHFEIRAACCDYFVRVLLASESRLVLSLGVKGRLKV